MGIRMLRMALGGVIVGALLAGCTGSSSGPPEPGPTSAGASGTPSSGSGGPSPGGAPKVQNPLDTTAFHQDPCRALTADQLPELLGADVPGTKRRGVSAPECEWRNRSTGASFGMQFVLANDSGLSTAYAQRHTYDLWQELPPIEGYPAVVADLRDSRNTLGACTVLVGVTDSLEFSVSGNLSDAKRGKADPCQAIQLAAKLMLQTMKKGGA